MIVRDYKGKLVYFNKEEYSSEYNMYVALWKIMYNIDLYDEKSRSKSNRITRFSIKEY